MWQVCLQRTRINYLNFSDFFLTIDGIHFFNEKLRSLKHSKPIVIFVKGALLVKATDLLINLFE